MCHNLGVSWSASGTHGLLNLSNFLATLADPLIFLISSSVKSMNLELKKCHFLMMVSWSFNCGHYLKSRISRLLKTTFLPLDAFNLSLISATSNSIFLWFFRDLTSSGSMCSLICSSHSRVNNGIDSSRRYLRQGVYKRRL